MSAIRAKGSFTAAMQFILAQRAVVTFSEAFRRKMLRPPGSLEAAPIADGLAAQLAF